MCIIDSSPVQHSFCPQRQVMCAETCWTRTMNLSQNDCPFGRRQAAADVPTVLVTFGKRAHKQTVSHGSSSGVNADNRAQSRRRCAATWQIIRVRIKQRWDQHRGDRSFKFVCFVFVGWHSLPVSCFYSMLFYSILYRPDQCYDMYSPKLRGCPIQDDSYFVDLALWCCTWK